ncbi:MDMPI N domain containing protein [Kitasatospora sp. McL0602]|uniref:MDMPI N domain containing protein n=1 Tax=Kitasatospora sp. McL0602 TaxID=3439530 RepID=UPI003F888256
MAAVDPHEDDALHRRLADGEESALGELYDRYAPPAHGLAQRLMGDQAAAEHLTCEIFAGLWTNPGTARLGADAVLEAADPLDPPVALRQQVLDRCLARRPALLPVPPWAAPYAAETARLDSLLRDLGPAEWQETVELAWHGGVERLRPAQVLRHLAEVDARLAPALGLPADGGQPPAPGDERSHWRRQSHALVRRAGLGAVGTALVDHGFAVLPLHDAFLDRAFECWIHGDDIARAVDYPYTPPAPKHLRLMVDLAARMLPAALAARPTPTPPLPRLVRLVVEGPAAGEWLVPLDGTADNADVVASVAVDGLEFCYLAAARRDPARLPVGQYGDAAAVRQLLEAAPLLSRP